MVNGYPNVFMIIRTYQNQLSALRQSLLLPFYFRSHRFSRGLVYWKNIANVLLIM